MKFHLIQYRSGSRGATQLQQALQTLGHTCRRTTIGDRHEALLPYCSTRNHTLVVNWGKSVTGGLADGGDRITMRSRDNYILNNEIGILSNKLDFFHRFTSSDELVPYSTSFDHARQWFANGGKVVCRTVLDGHSGNGIILLNSPEEVPPAVCRLFTKYVPKKSEFRVHISRYNTPEQDIWQQKRSIRGLSNVNYKIRNHQNGWIFTRERLEIPEEARRCIQAFRSWVFSNTNIDFGAVDIIYNERNNKAYVLEVNSAPGLEGQTVDDYAQMLVRAHDHLI